MEDRVAKINRKTKETDISVELNLDGVGKYEIDTGIGFLDHMLTHLSKHGKIDFSEPVPEGKSARRRVISAEREKIREWRELNLSAGQITECLSEDGIEISVRTVERVLREEVFPKLPRRTRLKMGMTVKRAHIPDKSRVITLEDMNDQKIQSSQQGSSFLPPFWLNWV